ncbi:MAG: polysaccharide pyruvyl transferase family protein, partial [Desulfobacteraceae bacterium]|nr:polysaccharide pyruvyl transferase family protein [Desulfobacteraceae bacterium]
AVRWADILIMGGGPLMHITPMFMVEHAFKVAKKKRKKTIICGCGVGPIFSNKYKKTLISIIDNSDLVILRDKISRETLYSIYDSCGKKLKASVFTGFDPAVECVLIYNELKNKNKFPGPAGWTEREDVVCINLREFPGEYSRQKIKNKVDNVLKQFVHRLSSVHSDKLIYLLPMHYFHIGTDDRYFLNKIYFAAAPENKNIVVQNKPLSLLDTLHAYASASINIGMRFHSVVFQTLLKGNNYILDYTEPDKGKIFGFINDIDDSNFYYNRMVSLHDQSLDLEKFATEIYSGSRCQFDHNKIIKNLNVYPSKLQDLFR